jgi:hypothetical protein
VSSTQTVSPAPSENTLNRKLRGLGGFIAAALSILGLLSSFFLAKSKAFAFVDVGADTYYCFYPLQLAVSKQLHLLGTATWSFDLGLGGFLGSRFLPHMRQNRGVSKKMEN